MTGFIQLKRWAVVLVNVLCFFVLCLSQSTSHDVPPVLSDSDHRDSPEDTLWTWASSNGLSAMHVRVAKAGAKGLGLQAFDSVDAGEVVFHVPSQLIIGSHTPRWQQITRVQNRHSLEHLDTLALVRCLLSVSSGNLSSTTAPLCYD